MRYCPECGEDNVDVNPPFATCNECGWEGRADDLTEVPK
jgi:hypothetical protein